MNQICFLLFSERTIYLIPHWFILSALLHLKQNTVAPYIVTSKYIVYGTCRSKNFLFLKPVGNVYSPPFNLVPLIMNVYSVKHKRKTEGLILCFAKRALLALLASHLTPGSPLTFVHTHRDSVLEHLYQTSSGARTPARIRVTPHRATVQYRCQVFYYCGAEYKDEGVIIFYIL